ncbi:MAG: ribonuclease III [Alphaproteobacteria bacterium]|nr:ribonuclease III [Alphaproteobacteria bacterium]
MRALTGLEGRLGHCFADRARLAEALTHASASGRNNERLEFLGDRVLGLLAAEALIERFPDSTEGLLAQRLNALVRREACADVAQSMGLGDCLLMSEGEAAAGGREKPAILADACEAIIGALYLDAGLEAVRPVFRRFWARLLDEADTTVKDPKTMLQEWAHATHGVTPDYRMEGREGPDHAPSFTVSVSVGPLAPERGPGASKRAAEQAAALGFLRREGIAPDTGS